MGVYVLLIISFLAAVGVAIYGLRPLLLTGDKLPEYKEDDEGMKKSVSVIVYASGISSTLHEYIHRLMGQNYPNMKVIMVCYADSDNTTSLSDEYSKKYPNLYFTFIPPGAKNQSRHKLAYLVGIKAADTEVVLTTNSECEIPSSNWVSEMMKPFNESAKTDLVLGYSSPEFTEIKSADRLYKEFDYLMTASWWIGYAKMGKAYRGDGTNMAFRRDLFFKNNGYASSNRIHGGDDDIFVSEISNSENTKVVLNSDSQLKYNWHSATSRMLTSLKERYIFTSRFLPKLSKINSVANCVMQWIVLLGVVAAIVLNFTCCPDTLIMSIVKTLIGVVILLGMFAMEIIYYRRATVRLKSEKQVWGIPFFMLWRPIDDVIFYLRHIKTRNNNYIWK